MFVSVPPVGVCLGDEVEEEDEDEDEDEDELALL